MKGLELCENYFQEVGLPLLQRECPELLDCMAIGLAGDGSECYGYDDEISRDHDWGPGFCIWLAKDDYEAIGRKVQEIYERMPRTYKGYGPRLLSQWGDHRIGTIEIGAFYRQFIGKYQPPNSYDEWLILPENALAAATNGKVFRDPLGEFTRIRESLLQFYPEDVRLMKIASRCMTIGQAGQYNFPRCAKRGELYAARHAEIKFCAEAMSLAFLLNKRYPPFYKWIHRALGELPCLGGYMSESIVNLVEEHDYLARTARIEAISQTLLGELRRQGLTDHASDFLPDHAPVIQQGIRDRRLREASVLAG
jgi:hypothetical protein